MTDKITKDDTSEAASALTVLIECEGASETEKKALKAALSAVWGIHDRLMDEESE